ncbi:MAG: hypothetical protein WDA07_02240 [Leucobacter sp.]
MTPFSTTKSSDTAVIRRMGRFATFTGSLLLAGGGAAWCAVTKQLRDENITVPGNAPALAGRRVQDPATAYVEAIVIKRNAERSAGGRTFADISDAMREVEKGSDEEKQLRGQSAALSTAASLRTSLMTAVLAYGVSALVIGLGGFLAVVGSQFRRAGSR